MQNIFYRSANNYDMDAVSRENGLAFEGPGRTKQEFKDETDINVILRRFSITGQLPDNVRMPTYADFTDVFDFQTAVNAIAEARESFETMPAHVRARFSNDPGAFVAFCSNPANLDEARKLGLVPASESKPETRAPAATAPGGPEAPGPVLEVPKAPTAPTV